MTDAMHCNGYDWLRWRQEDLAPDIRERMRVHLSGCQACSRFVGWMDDSESDTPLAPVPLSVALRDRLARLGAERPYPEAAFPVRRLPGIARSAAAAGLLLAGLAGAAVYVFRSVSFSPSLSEGGGAAAAPAGRFSDGTRIWKTDPDSRLSLLPGRPGRRLDLEMERGRVRVEVPPGEGVWTLRTPAGEVHVHGTTFQVFATRIPLDDRIVALTVVEVLEGIVSIHGASGQGYIRAGHRGILFADRPPVTQIRIVPLAPALFLEAFRALLREPDKPLPESAWLPFLAFHAQAADLLLEEFPNLEDPRARDWAMRMIAGLGMRPQRAALRTMAQARKEEEVLSWLAAWEREEPR